MRFMTTANGSQKRWPGEAQTLRATWMRCGTELRVQEVPRSPQRGAVARVILRFLGRQDENTRIDTATWKAGRIRKSDEWEEGSYKCQKLTNPDPSQKRLYQPLRRRRDSR